MSVPDSYGIGKSVGAGSGCPMSRVLCETWGFRLVDSYQGIASSDTVRGARRFAASAAARAASQEPQRLKARGLRGRLRHGSKAVPRYESNPRKLCPDTNPTHESCALIRTKSTKAMHRYEPNPRKPYPDTESNPLGIVQTPQSRAGWPGCSCCGTGSDGLVSIADPECRIAGSG
jgi:hypothetical protein